MSENVKDLLDSLDIKQGQKAKPKKSSSKRKEHKKAGDDILGFLDNLDKKDVARPEKASDAPASDAPASDDAPRDDAPRDETPRTEDTSTAEESVEIDPVASISSWWSRNKGGIWSKVENASNSLQDAVTETVKQARHAEASARDEQAAGLSSWQSKLTSVLNTIIPPISRHEQLHIHIFHDMVGYPSVDKLLYEVFDYVMDQVEGGGDLNLVVQKGKERHRVGSDHDVHRDLNAARCSLDVAAKLAKANVEGIPPAPAEEPPHPSIRISEVYVSIQPVIIPEGELYFVVYLLDKEHSVEIATNSQGMPEEWAKWLDDAGSFKDAPFDPREWVFGWIEDALSLAFGVTAQQYVTTRMGITSRGASEESEPEST